MWFLYIISAILFVIPLLEVLIYSACIYLFIGLPLKLFGRGHRVRIYARNLALSISDQGLATIFGQAPDISISEALGLAARMHEEGDAYVSPFVLKFGVFVDWLFWNKFWKIEKNHIRKSLDRGESFKNTITHWHFTDADTQSRIIDKYIGGINANS